MLYFADFTPPGYNYHVDMKVTGEVMAELAMTSQSLCYENCAKAPLQDCNGANYIEDDNKCQLIKTATSMEVSSKSHAILRKRKFLLSVSALLVWLFQSVEGSIIRQDMPKERKEMQSESIPVSTQGKAGNYEPFLTCAQPLLPLQIFSFKAIWHSSLWRTYLQTPRDIFPWGKDRQLTLIPAYSNLTLVREGFTNHAQQWWLTMTECASSTRVTRMTRALLWSLWNQHQIQLVLSSSSRAALWKSPSRETPSRGLVSIPWIPDAMLVDEVTPPPNFSLLLTLQCETSGLHCRVLKSAGSQALVSVCQHTLVGLVAARFFIGWQWSSAKLLFILGILRQCVQG